jgi:hypothetical protein
MRRTLERATRSKEGFSRQYGTHDSRNSSKNSKTYSVNKSVNSWKRELNISVNQDARNGHYSFLKNYQAMQNS